MSYDRNANRLQQVQIATPCSAAWSDMSGDHRSRHCAQCNKRVYNLSQMSSEEALALLDRDAGGVCIQLYKRRDGTVLTSDCPKGRQTVAQRIYRQVAQAVSCMAAAQAFACAPAQAKDAKAPVVQGKQLAGRATHRKVVAIAPPIEVQVLGGAPVPYHEPLVVPPIAPPVLPVAPPAPKAPVDHSEYAQRPIDVFYGR